MLDIKLFGATVVTKDGAVLTPGLGGAKPRQILEILALSAGTTVSKDQLADLLWDGHPPRSYLGTLESYVCLLRRGLGLSRGHGSALATVVRGYVLDPDLVTVDLHDFRRLSQHAALARHDPAEALDRLEQALDLVGGELLTGAAYASWALTEREAFRRELVATASLAATHALAVGREDIALRRARQAIAADVLAEEAWCLLMRALSATGRSTDALRAYLELRGHLAAELGTDPSAGTDDLYLQILRGGNADRPGTSRDGREEVRMLMSLLRQAVAAIPGLEQPRSNHALFRVAADLVA